MAKKQPPRFQFKKWLKAKRWKILRWALALFIGAGALLFLLILFYAHDLPSTDKLGSLSRHPSVRLISVEGEMVANFGDVYGDYVRYKDIPLPMIQAVMATEDRRFFDHFGIDIFGIMRAMGINIIHGRVVQGGSTITQQLAKIVFLTPERSLKRKVQELMLAMWLERKFTKEQILEMYLNRVYLGAGNYGIDAAGRSYFSKKASDLNVQEAAVLAGLLKAPTKFSPANDPVKAAERGKQVLMAMQDAGYISENMVTDIAANIERKPRGGARNNYYYADWIAEQLPGLVGMQEDDITVVVTLDPKLQRAAEEAVITVLNDRGKVMRVSQGALVSLAPDGKVLAMVGGRNYGESQFNRVTQAQRQPGSSFKMFVYLTAFMQGWGPNDVMEDKPLQIGDWKPENYDGEYTGPVLLRDALAKSINSVAVQLADLAGVQNIVNLAYRMGIESNLEPNLSIALGTSEVNLLELTKAYAVLGNNGVTVQPYGIIEVRTAKGDVLYSYEPPHKEQLVNPETVAKMNVALMQVLENGTGRKGKVTGRDVAAKSGTSQDFRDAWFIGFTPQITTGVWMGNDDNRKTDGVTGGGLPAIAFHAFMEKAHEGLPVLPLPTDGRYVPSVLPAIDPAVRERMMQEEENKRNSFWNRIFGENDRAPNPNATNFAAPQPAGDAPQGAVPPARPVKQKKVDYSYPTSRH